MRSALMLVALLSGCSTGMMTRYDPAHPETRTTCDSSYGLPILDVVMTVATAAGSVLLFAKGVAMSDDTMAAPNPDATIVITGGILVAATSIAYVASAAQGFSNAGACRRAR